MRRVVTIYLYTLGRLVKMSQNTVSFIFNFTDLGYSHLSFVHIKVAYSIVVFIWLHEHIELVILKNLSL